ncbi:hypothetical protein BRADI_4g12300v3 [Brachypodium distachyon]|uniref:Uncharacterized protein n=1 Tax=Brachypodium distachyon TaxID=15368 RepID=A0A2K2CMC2_BRADI|nr:hypothetical protein BRADI_4g12300v3 [Brachypodium distachyon]
MFRSVAAGAIAPAAQEGDEEEDESLITESLSASIDDQGAIAPAAQERDEEDKSLITEILTISPAKSLDTRVACLIAWASDDIDRVNYFEPSMVRIGPFHRQDPSQQSADRMEQKKKRVLPGLLASNEQDEAGRREELRSHLEAMESVERVARRCYNRSFGWMTSKEYAHMLLLDGCFLYSRFVSAAGIGDDIAVDRDVIFLLENQIPFFVLEEIHRQLIKTGRVQDTSPGAVLDEVAKRVRRVLQRNNYIALGNVNVPSSHPSPCHLLHLLYMYFTPTLGRVPATPAPAGRPGSIAWFISIVDTNGNRAGPPLQGQPTNNNNNNNTSDPVLPQVRWRTATQYYAAGVGFVKRKLGDQGARCILDVELTVGWLTGGTLHVPCLTIDINTFRMLRNMVALEQKSLQQTSQSSHVTAYCLFLSQIAGTKEDVELLVSKGIIAHLLRSIDDVAQGLAGLCSAVVFDVDNPDLNYLSSKHKALEPLYHSNWGRAIAWLWHVKCDNPLKALAVLAAVVVSIVTVLQLVFAGLSYGRGN